MRMGGYLGIGIEDQDETGEGARMKDGTWRESVRKAGGDFIKIEEGDSKSHSFEVV